MLYFQLNHNYDFLIDILVNEKVNVRKIFFGMKFDTV